MTHYSLLPVKISEMQKKERGIFKTYEMRSVQHFIHFAAIGSGAKYALGALYALYDRYNSVEDIARATLDSVVEFDSTSGLPGTFQVIRCK